MRSAKKLLQLLTERIPPGGQQHHKFIVEEDKLVLCLIINSRYCWFDITDEDLDQPAIVVASRICELITE